ncbi:sodium-dependent serotonin transporter-like [Episyrphus balteatus]|uniref:sodium-dependent serotonin transporter-like n=1 Tax=Episyrphus balteatus TaxID=286459 RepID=UPI00248694E1|nr:sodium-dependent serotonin transporter-like [Episyrphus balteatus]
MTSADNHRHVSSYDIGAKPFRHDPERGKWSSRLDFYFACLCQSFGWEALCEIPVYIFFTGGGFSIISFLLSVLFVGIPIFFIQSYLGQFSSTGLISAFRVVPLFKGIGYLIVIFNVISLTYYSVFAAVPLYYFIESIQPILPWMSCNQSWNSPNCSTRNNFDFEDEAVNPHATVEFFRSKIRGIDGDRGPLSISSGLLINTLAIWLMVSLVFFQKIKLIGKLFRITAVILFAAFLVVFLRLFCLSGFQEALKGFSFEIPELHLIHPHVGANLVMLFFRPGWGNIVNLASHNTFKTDIMKMSFMVCLSGFGMIMLAATSGRIVWDHFEDHVGGLYLQVDEEHSLQFIYLCYAFLLGELPYANLWCALFFGALCLVEVIKLIVQLFSVLTSLFDEYEKLRATKKEVTVVLTAFLCVLSICFCSNYGIIFAELLTKISTVSQMVLNLFLILVVFWIYGKDRFQRDVTFMTDRIYPTWMINIVRLVAPIILFIAWASGAVISLSLGLHSFSIVTSILVIVLLPWLLVPGYCIFKILQTTGMLNVRLRRALRPTDWYPVDSMYRDQYEEAFSQSEISHQLTTTIAECAFSALPLLYFVHSMRPTIPWSCEGAKQWMNINQTICNKEHPPFHKIPSFEFLRQHLNISNTNSDTAFSLQLMIYTAIIWVIATSILLKSTKFLFEPISFRRGIEISISDLTILVFSTLGPGWGSILTMASFNDFKTNIYRFSWLVCLGQIGVFIGMGFIWRILTQVIRSYGITTYISPLEKWSKIFTIPTILSFMELPNFWSLLFFGMFVLGILNLLVIQLHSLFTSIFDEYENLREMKKYFILGAVIVLGFISMFFCSNHGLYLIEILSKFSILIQAILNMFLLLVVLWIYGRGRFQRDLNFMTSQVYSTWMVYVVRFVAPIVLGLLFCTTFRWIMERLLYFDYTLVWLPFLIISCIFYLKLCCLIPCYCIFKIRQLPGSICVRLIRCVRPIDWYPADPIHKQNYEEGFSRTDSLRIFPMLVFVGAQIVLTYFIFNYFS